ncbi:MAG TPA: hypothetical protein VEZ11_16575, partial [Thermoanaerobaculia bacterium]|nr:hypothetical protein [Thermoanaerobaculia bacterium]
ENRTVSSLAYFRAVIAARRGSMRDAILLAAEAEQVAPGDPHVLALRVALANAVSDSATAAAAAKRLADLHDPFTIAEAVREIQEIMRSPAIVSS